MKKLLCFLFIIVPIFLIGTKFCYAQNGWQTLNSGTTKLLHGLFFLNEQVGWVCGQDGLIKKTTDGGLSWITQREGGNYLQRIQFINENVGYAIGGYDNTNPTVIKTLDGGITWFSQDPNTTIGLNGLFFINEQLGWITGYYGTIRKTTNGGLFWTIQTPPGSNNYWFYNIKFFNDNIGWISGEAGKILHTTDGGITWVQKTSPSYTHWPGLCIVNDNIVYIAGYVRTGFGKIIKTTDAGANWTIINATPTDAFYSVSFIDQNQGWVTTIYGHILVTYDGGVTWKQQVSGTTQGLVGLQMLNANVGYAVGYNGTILKTTTGGEKIPDIIDGLVAYYPFNGNANDESGNGNDGIVNGATLSTDRFGRCNQAYSFNGINNSIEVNNSSSLQLTNAFTFTFWTYINQWYNNEWGTFISKSSWVNSPKYLIATHRTDGWNLPINYTNNVATPYMTPLEAYKWKFVTWIWDGNNSYLYVDNQKYVLNNYSGTQDIDNGTLTIGTVKHPIPGAITWLNGKMDDIRIYNRTLTDSEIQQLYLEDNNLNNGLVAYYPFNGNANDESGNGHDGIVNGATLTTDRFGNQNRAYSFDGISNDINLNGTFGGEREVSVSAWFNVNGSTETFQAIFESQSGGDTGDGYIHLQCNTFGNNAVYFNNGYCLLPILSPTPYGDWRHVVITAKSGDIRLYENSVQVAKYSNTFDFITISDKVKIGSGWLGRYFKGQIDEIRIYNRALTDCEIQALFNETSDSIYNPKTDTIGCQVWMKKNLDVDHYRNGDPIPQVTDPTQWANLTTGAWCYYSNDPSNGVIYGKIYNWFAVNDSRGLAPQGWHVPSDAEWSTLATYLGGTSVAGGKLKETGTTHWNSPNTGATNETGFTGLPSGSRSYMNGLDYEIGQTGGWWSSTENIPFAYGRYLAYNSANINRDQYYKNNGFPVRCVKDENQDNTPPTAICKDIIIQLDESGTAQITASQIDNGSYDDCIGIKSISLSSCTFDCSNTGSNTVTLIVTDNNHNVSTCNTIVEIIDITAPIIINNPSNIIAYTGADDTDCFVAVTWVEPTATDNCPFVNLTSDYMSGDEFPIGKTTVKYIAEDASGNRISATFNIEVIDDTAPIITNIPSNIIAYTGPDDIDGYVAVTWVEPTATDNCSYVNLTSNYNHGNEFPIGMTLVKYTAEDASGNKSEATFNMEVIDNTDPKITMFVFPKELYELWPPNHKMWTLQASVDATDNQPGVSFILKSIVSSEADMGLGFDDVAGDIQNAEFGTPDLSFDLRAERYGTGDGRIYSITYEATDAAGNKAQAIVNVLVKHSQAQNEGHPDVSDKSNSNNGIEIKDIYPNPFDNNVKIILSESGTGIVDVSIYNYFGQKVKTIMTGFVPDGIYERIWDGTDENNHYLSNGIYFLRALADGEIKFVRNIILNK